MTASPFQLAGASITHSGHCSRDKSNYVLTHQLLHSSPSSGKKHPRQPMQQKHHLPNSSHLGMLGGQGTLLCLGWRGDIWSLGRNKGRKEKQHPSCPQGWGWGWGWGYRLCGSAPHHRGSGIDPSRPGASASAWLELSRKCYIHRIQQRFDTTLYTQNKMRFYICYTLENRKKQYLQKTL